MSNKSNSNNSTKSINKMSKLHNYQCPCGYQMYIDYEYDKHDNVTIVVSCECGFSWGTTFGQVDRITKNMIRRAIDNFYDNHHHPDDCNCDHNDEDDEDHDGDSDYDPYQ